MSRRVYHAAIALCAAACAREPRRDGALTMLTLSQPEHLDPRFPEDALGAALGRLVHPGLMTTDPRTFRPTLGLARAVRHPTPTRVVAEIDPSARFHDGSPVTADDVVATYRSVLDPASTSRLRATYARSFASVDALGPRTVAFTLRAPDGSAESLLGLGVLPRALAAGGEILARPGDAARFDGAGAMRVSGLPRGDWAFAAVGEGPRSMRVVTLRDPNTLTLRLLHGRGDLAELKPDVLSLFEGDARVAIRAAPTSGVTYLGLHCAHGALSDPRVRRALAHAIDRDGLRRARVGRYGVTATGVLPPAHWAYTAEVQRYPYDPARARALLDEAGLRASGESPRARFTLRVSSQRAAILSAQAIAAMLREVGVEVDVRPSELATLLSDLRAGRFDLTLLTIPDLSDPWGLGFWFGTASIPTARNPGAGGNRWRFSDARLDAALERGLREHDPARRAPHYRDAQRVLAEQLPVIPLWHADVVWALRRPWTGLSPRGDGMLDFVTAIRRVAP